MNAQPSPAPRLPLAPNIALLVAVCSTGIAGAPAPSAPLPDQARFLQQVRIKLESDRLLQRQYTYKGSHIVFQRRKVSDSFWLPSELSYSAGGRVLLVKKLRVEGVREYSDYKEVGVDGLTALWQPHPGK